MNKILIGVLVLILVGSGVYFFTVMQKNSTDTAMVKEEVVVAPSKAAQKVDTMREGTAVAEKGAVKTFNVSAENFSFSVAEIRVKEGDTVKVVFTNKEGFHDWVVDEFGAKTKQLASGKSETIEFVVDKIGVYEYYCSVGAHRANGMVGRLIVE